MQTMLSIKLDKSLKQKAQDLAHTLGVSLNAVMNRLLKDFILERTITFTDHPVLNKKARKNLDRLLADSKANRNMVGPFTSMEDMIKSLDS
jgi:addiction module RelB/DinJ family antitoxin